MLVNSLIIQHSEWYYTYRSVPAEHIYDKVIDKSSPADYEIPAVTTDISVTPSPAYATTTFTDRNEDKLSLPSIFHIWPISNGIDPLYLYNIK